MDIIHNEVRKLLTWQSKQVMCVSLYSDANKKYHLIPEDLRFSYFIMIWSSWLGKWFFKL